MADVGDAKFPDTYGIPLKSNCFLKRVSYWFKSSRSHQLRRVVVIIYVTGDTHADFKRFSSKSLSVRVSEYEKLTKDDYVIICGDFGGVWSYGTSSSEEEYWLNWLDNKPFTTLFVDGNHENYDRLKEFPRINYHGGVAHRIRNSIYHLMRGYVFEFEGKKFFTFGGAKSHDIKDGILDLKNFDSLSDLVKHYNMVTRFGMLVRINHISWWKEELPSSAEMKRGIKNLEKHNFEVDYVITHCAPLRISMQMYSDDSDKLTRYLDSLLDMGLKFKEWHFGHYHREQKFGDKFFLHYQDIERLI